VNSEKLRRSQEIGNFRMGFRGSGVQISASRPFKIKHLRPELYRSFFFLDPHLVPLGKFYPSTLFGGIALSTRVRCWAAARGTAVSGQLRTKVPGTALQIC